MPKRPPNQPSAVGLGSLRHRARIQHEEICWFPECYHLVPVLFEPVRQQGGFSLIESAANRVQRGSQWFLAHGEVIIRNAMEYSKLTRWLPLPPGMPGNCGIG